MGPGEFGGSDDFHGFGDLFDVADGLEAAFNFAEGGIASSIRGDGPTIRQDQFDLVEKFVVSSAFGRLLWTSWQGDC